VEMINNLHPKLRIFSKSIEILSKELLLLLIMALSLIKTQQLCSLKKKMERLNIHLLHRLNKLMMMRIPIRHQ